MLLFAIGFTDEVDAVFSTSFCFEQTIVGLIKKLGRILAIAREACNPAADGQNTLSFGA